MLEFWNPSAEFTLLRQLSTDRVWGFFSLSVYKLSPLYSESAQKLRMQNVAEKSLPIYLLMSNCGSRRDVDNKPSVSETF